MSLPRLARSRSALLAVLVVVVAACSGATSPTPAASGPAPSAAQSTVPSTAPSDQGGKLSVGLSSDVFTLDPAIGYDVYSWPAERLLYDTLVTYDGGTTIVPSLAAEMPTISADGLTYTFKLRPGVKFVGKGGEPIRDLTADDVAWSLSRLMRPDLTPTVSPVGTGFFTVIKGADEVNAGTAELASGIKAIDPLTVEITLNQPDRTFLNILAMPFGSIVPKESAGTDTAAFAAAPVGTGPYWLESFTQDQVAVFQRNPQYWREGLPKADTIEFRFSQTAENQASLIKANELDITLDLLSQGDWAALSNDPQYKDRIALGDMVAFYYLMMDMLTDGNPFQDQKVRQAVNTAIDKDNIIRVVSGRGTIADCIFPPLLPGHDPSCKPYAFDVEQGKKLMAESPYPNGFSTKLYTDDVTTDGAVAEAIKADLAKIGIEVEVVQQPFDTLLGTMTTPGAAPLVYLGWFQDFPDPSDFIDPILSCATVIPNGFNVTGYCNEQLDKDGVTAKANPDLNAVLPDYQDFQKRIMTDAPIAPILVPKLDVFHSERTPDFTIHPVWAFDLQSIAVKE